MEDEEFYEDKKKESEQPAGGVENQIGGFFFLAVEEELVGVVKDQQPADQDRNAEKNQHQRRTENVSHLPEEDVSTPENRPD